MSEIIEKFVIKFDYNLEFLQSLVKEVETLDITDLELVRETHKKFVKIRTTIKKQEKEMVDEANDFRNRVFSKRNEYLEITEPVEEKLKGIMEAEEARLIMEARKELLPMKKAQLGTLQVAQPTDEEILAMDDTQWVEFYNQKFSEHTTKIENAKKAEQEAKERIEREAKIKADAEAKAEIEKAELLKKAEEDKIKAVEQAKKEAELKALKDKQEAEEKIRLEKLAEENRLKKEKEEIEAKEKADKEAQAKMEADKKYQNFLKENNYNEETDVLDIVGNKVKLYRLINTFNK